VQEIDNIDNIPTTQNIHIIKHINKTSSARLLKREILIRKWTIYE
jgi:hypothetical protein